MRYRKWTLVPVSTHQGVGCVVVSPYQVLTSLVASDTKEGATEMAKGLVDHYIEEYYPTTPLGRYPPPTSKCPPPGQPPVRFGRCANPLSH